MIPDLPRSAEQRGSRACVSCGGSERHTVHASRVAAIAGLDLGYDVVECAGCGASFADRLAPAADYAAYYRSCSKYDSIEDPAQVPAVDRRRAAFAVDLVKTHSATARRVLDLGCGSGVLLAQFDRAGFSSACGIDPAPNAPASAQRLFGLHGVRQGTIDAVTDQFQLADFDVVCMTGVLEHLLEPAMVLRRIGAGLAPGARLLVEVPALEHFAHAPLEPYGEFSLEHVNFFSRRSLLELARRSGLRPVASAVVELWPAASDSLYLLLEQGPSDAAVPAAQGHMADYLAASSSALRPMLARASAAIAAGEAVLWGAGSHSARLLPALENLGLGGGVRAVLDSNPNLHGRSFGRHEVQAPDKLRQYPQATVIVSSFRSSAPIAQGLRARFANPVCELYAPLASAAGGATPDELRDPS